MASLFIPCKSLHYLEVLTSKLFLDLVIRLYGKGLMFPEMASILRQVAAC